MSASQLPQGAPPPPGNSLSSPSMSMVHVVVPACAGSLMLVASVLPWLNDPLGNIAWNLPIDIGWQFHSMLLSYGLLCLCCAGSAFLLAGIYWRQQRAGRSVEIAYLPLAGLFCLFPLLCFLLQYLCADIHGIEALAQQRTQLLLVQQHFGYKIPEQFIQLQPLDFTPSTLTARFTLLANEVSAGLLLPLVSASLLMSAAFFAAKSQMGIFWKKHRCLLLVGLCALLLLIRAPLALVSDYQAKEALAAGNYMSASRWLDRAVFLNPSFEQSASYHIQRGQAAYFLSNGAGSSDSHEYLAFVYRGQGNYLEAYQELRTLQRSAPVGSSMWIATEMSATLTHLAEMGQRQASTPLLSANADTMIQPWLQALLELDNKNVYGHYMLGRIRYDLHNYTACIAEMTNVLQISQNRDVQSSAYTYMALSLLGKGYRAEARQLLLKAIALDPAYRNNTAREELSGLH